MRALFQKSTFQLFFVVISVGGNNNNEMNSIASEFQFNNKLNFLDEPFEAKRIIQKVLRTGFHDAFYLINVDDLKRKYYNWMEKMPRVRPFYAVKCNNHQVVLKTLLEVGAGFDCAFSEEFNQMIELGVSCEDIIYANPIKSLDEIQHAREKNVKTMTFDSEGELQRIKLIFPEARLVIRIRCDAAVSTFNFGKKFGADPEKEAPHLLDVAKSLGLNVVGVSFHVGTLCGDIDIYEKAIRHSRSVFDYAKDVGYELTLLDIGGGFSGKECSEIDPIANIVNLALAKYFPDNNVSIIAEPGRYFVESALVFACGINAIRKNTDFASGETTQIMYYLNGGVYGAFLGNKIEGIANEPTLLKQYSTPVYNSIVWGPTCCAYDQVCDDIELPELEVGDWMMFENMGAYTLSSAFEFNGFPVPPVFCFASK